MVYSGIWDRNFDDQMWSCHFGKNLEQIIQINRALQTSEEGCYLPTRMSKVSHNNKILFTCIWKVPLDYCDDDDDDIPDLKSNEESKEKQQPRPQRPKFEWSPEQQEVIDTFGKENRWKFHFETIVEYSLT